MWKIIAIAGLAITLNSCAEIEPKPFEPSSGHINTEAQPAGEIPALVTQVPILPEPEPPVELERYTVVVNEVPVKELLFALARDARINVDIDPAIDGVATINAVDQTLPQILERISRQVDLRYEFEGDNLIIDKDEAFLRTYAIDYVNISRDTSSSNTIATQITATSGGAATKTAGGGGNNSTTDVTSVSNHHFWERLVLNIAAILGESSTGAGGGSIPITDSVIPNPESGILTVRATKAQHRLIQEFIDSTLASAKRQVMIQATIVEVTLSDKYQAGIDWSFLNQAGKAGINIISTTLAGAPIVGALSSFVISAVDPNTSREESLTATVSLLDEFGDTRVLSSPQIMALNNQTALLKVVENFVYFEIDADTTTSTLGVTLTTVDSTAKTVPVGIVMAVTPQIDSGDVITLNVRPTVSRVVATVNDPNPNIPAGLENPVPQIAVKEMESILRLTNGQIGVLGGLMTDETRDRVSGLPGISKQPLFGNLFKTTAAEYTKTELVIFLRPLIIRNPGVDSDLQPYKTFLSPEHYQRVLPEKGEDAL
ncbi:MAG: hypothetical protein A2W28_10465 [Gammaproteobacteria bacterium RBG_16_51_14]|nr:MAG: hypothetical protein A2W28_10465 [Gammaproteobacteria bacterium RBG_16_51_14]